MIKKEEKLTQLKKLKLISNESKTHKIGANKKIFMNELKAE